MSDEEILVVLKEIRNWVRAASYASVKTHLEAALPDSKSRFAYQMLDGTASLEKVRTACKMSPNSLVALAQRCTAMGLMHVQADRKRLRLFDLADFGLITTNERSNAESKGGRQLDEG